MCDFCGCRSQPAIDELSAEHERLLDLVYALRRDAARSDHATVVRTLETAIVPLLHHHTDKEERGLFAQLRAAWEADARLSALESEHRHLEELIATVLRGAAGWSAVVGRMADELSQHVFDEETDLFPYALYELDDARWDAVEAVHASTRPAVGPVTVRA